MAHAFPQGVGTSIVRSKRGTKAPSRLRRLVTADQRIVPHPNMRAVSLEAGLLTGYRSTMQLLAPVILQAQDGGLLCAHFEQRFGFRLTVQESGEAWDRVLVDGTLPHDLVEVSVGRRAIMLPRDTFVPEKLALRAMTHYAATGERCPRSSWLRA